MISLKRSAISYATTIERYCMKFASPLVLFLLFFVIYQNAFASNALSKATSPYLLQHKDNPVDWYPWGEEAFEKAKKENKLIFLSIGYSTCHWCHEMAHESFENEALAQMLNRSFVSIKVDREELPHIDKFYQNIYKTMNRGGGGWPLTIMMDAQKRPFLSATFVPLQSGYGSEGLVNMIRRITATPREKLSKIGEEVLAKAVYAQKPLNANAISHADLANKTLKALKRVYDYKNGGLYTKPKFPHASTLLLLLKIHEITQDKESLALVFHALDAMARSGIYDQIDGGFYRYCVDERWQIPHFEKMLYTSAELIEVYALAYKITHNPLYKRVVQESIEEMERRFERNGLYMSASNADSKNRRGKNEEGFYFLFEYNEALGYLRKAGMDDLRAQEALEYLGVGQEGNFDGELSNPSIKDRVAPQGLTEAKELLKEMRAQREYPFIDNKINSAWNALYIKAKLKAAHIDKRYEKEALSSLRALLESNYIQGELYHQNIVGRRPWQKGLLEDYAFVGDALFEAYEATLDPRYYELFSQIMSKSVTLFYKNQSWFESNDASNIVADVAERAYASALAVQSMNLYKSALLHGERKQFGYAKEIIEHHSAAIDDEPLSFPTAVLAALMLREGAVLIKSKRENIARVNHEEIRRAFVYRHVNNTDEYLACTIESCFSYDRDLEKVKRDIQVQRQTTR